MTLRRAFAVLLSCAVASFALSIGLYATAQDPDTAPQVADVIWADRPDSVSELETDSTAVVEAEVTEILPGPPLVSNDPSEVGPEHQIPTQRIALRTLDVLQGHMPESFELFKTGSEEVHLRNDPPYLVGERYVLFIRPRVGEVGTYLPAAPDGRLREENASGEVDGVISGPVDRELQGQTPEEIDREIGS